MPLAQCAILLEHHANIRMGSDDSATGRPALRAVMRGRYNIVQPHAC